MLFVIVFYAECILYLYCGKPLITALKILAILNNEKIIYFEDGLYNPSTNTL